MITQSIMRFTIATAEQETGGQIMGKRGCESEKGRESEQKWANEAHRWICREGKMCYFIREEQTIQNNDSYSDKWGNENPSHAFKSKMKREKNTASGCMKLLLSQDWLSAKCEQTRTKWKGKMILKMMKLCMEQRVYSGYPFNTNQR